MDSTTKVRCDAARAKLFHVLFRRPMSPAREVRLLFKEASPSMLAALLGAFEYGVVFGRRMIPDRIAELRTQEAEYAEASIKLAMEEFGERKRKKRRARRKS